MKKTRILSLLVVMVMMVSLLAACGGSSSSAAPAASTATSEAAGDADASTAAGDSEYDGPQVTMKIGLGAASTGHSGIALANFKERVEARTGGLFEVQTYPDSQLGSEREGSESVAIGTVEAFTVGMGVFATFHEKLQFANTPFLLSSREQSYRFYDGEFMQALNEEVRAATGIRVLGYGENGVRGLSNNKHEVRTPDDMVGLKIRVQENPLHLGMISALGGSPTPIAFPELYTSLSQKTVDGQDNGIPLTVNNKFYEVQTTYTQLAHCFDQLAFIVNDAWYEGLDPVLQTILDEEMSNWRDDIRQLAIDFDEDGIKTMEDAGLTVIELTDEERQAFKDKMDPVYETARDLVGSDFFDEVLAAVEDAA